MLDQIIKLVSDYLSFESTIYVVLAGYFLFFIVFYRREHNTIWKDFQGTDRILVGSLMGLLLYIFFIVPISVYIDSIVFLLPKYIRETYEIYEFAGLRTQFFSSALIFIPLISLRRKTYLFSKEGAEEIKKTIINYGKKFSYCYLLLVIISFFALISARYYYVKYTIYINYWSFIILSNILVTSLIFIGIYLSLTALVYFDKRKEYSDTLTSMFKILDYKIHENRKKYFVSIVIILSSVFLFSFLDHNFSLITPNFQILSSEIKGPLAIHRPIGADNWVFLKRKYDNITISYPFFNNTYYLMIKNPSNIQILPLFSMYIDNDIIERDDVKNYHKKNYIKINLPVNSPRWKKYDVKISYDYSIDASIIITENISGLKSLENGFYTINYTLTINNNYNESLTNYHSYAGLKLDPRLRNNTSVKYYEDDVLKEENDFDYMISQHWLYPDIYVPKMSTKKMHFVIVGKS